MKSDTTDDIDGEVQMRNRIRTSKVIQWRHRATLIDAHVMDKLDEAVKTIDDTGEDFSAVDRRKEISIVEDF